MRASDFLIYLSLVHSLELSLVIAGVLKSDDSGFILTCGDPDQELLTVTNLTLSHVPQDFPGNVTIGVKAEVKREIETPVSLFIEHHYNNTDAFQPDWNSFIYYSDICLALDNHDCTPDQKCSCPFKEGNYTWSDVEFAIPWEIPGPGDYGLNVNISSPQELITCFATFFSFSFDEEEPERMAKVKDGGE